MKKGKVYLIGAGPGDIGLLTIKGMKCLQKAETVIYDFHINAQILNYINHEAEFIYAGKRGGHHEMTQDETNRTLVEKAKEGKIVCRLKGGDPFVFGRGGEEAEILASEGLEFEIIPGVSSAVAAPAYAGIPLTHRDYSSSFAVITGNEQVSKPESMIDWSKYARGYDTLVFLMGIKNISSITSKLMENGRPAETPTAVIRWGTRPDQKTIVSTLHEIADKVTESKIRPPAVMVVGNTVLLRDKLKWYENKPLFGHRILITRQYNEEYEILERMGAEIFEFPTITTVPPGSYDDLDCAIEKVESYDWLVFTSANGFRTFMERLTEKERDIRDLKGIKICTIGSKTASAVRSYGMKVDIVPNEFNAEGLIDLFLKETGGDLKGIRILLPRAEVAREVFPQKVRELGGEIDTPASYRTSGPGSHSKRLERFLIEGKITIATFTSAATFNNLVDIIKGDVTDLLKDVTIAAIGPVTKKAVEKSGLTVHIMPEKATIKDMVEDLIANALKRGKND